MIKADEIKAIGHTIKPHGINGEIAATVDPEVDLDSLRCLVMDVDGINVPFFIASWRPRGAEAVLLSIDGVADESQAAALCGKTLYALLSDIPVNASDGEEGMYADDLVGWRVVSDEGDDIGEITAVDTSTLNAIFVVATPDGREVLLPVADELIVGLDPSSRVITMEIPLGLLDM